MSESMIERVARVLCIADGKDPDSLWPVAPAGEWPGKNNSTWVPLWEANYSKAARAAIEAMRELPEEPGPRYTAGEYSRRSHQAMIDDALSEKP